MSLNDHEIPRRTHNHFKPWNKSKMTNSSILTWDEVKGRLVLERRFWKSVYLAVRLVFVLENRWQRLFYISLRFSSQSLIYKNRKSITWYLVMMPFLIRNYGNLLYSLSVVLACCSGRWWWIVWNTQVHDRPVWTEVGAHTISNHILTDLYGIRLHFNELSDSCII